MRLRFLCLVLAMTASGLALTALAQQDAKTPGAGIVAGQVADASSGSGVRATITWTRQVSSERTTAAFTGAVLTDEKGNFEIAGLAAGTYAVCVSTPGLNYLDPCLWDDRPPQVDVKTGAKSTELKLAVREGVLMQFEVADKENKIARKGLTQGVELRAYIPLPEGRRVDLFVVRNKEDIHVIEAIVPNDRDLPMLIEAEGMQFTDLQGRPWNVNRAAYVIKKPDAGAKVSKASIEVKGR